MSDGLKPRRSYARRLYMLAVHETDAHHGVDPCTLYDLRDLRRALGPDSWAAHGTARATFADEVSW